jgi:hypothetical protein
MSNQNRALPSMTLPKFMDEEKEIPLHYATVNAMERKASNKRLAPSISTKDPSVDPNWRCAECNVPPTMTPMLRPSPLGHKVRFDRSRSLIKDRVQCVLYTQQGQERKTIARECAANARCSDAAFSYAGASKSPGTGTLRLMVMGVI